MKIKIPRKKKKKLKKQIQLELDISLQNQKKLGFQNILLSNNINTLGGNIKINIKF